MTTYKVPYSTTEIEFQAPAGVEVDLLTSNDWPGYGDPAGAIDLALAEPIGSPPLRDLAGPGSKVCIVFTDATRASPDRLLVPPMLRELAEAGVADEDVTLLCGIGMHRPSTVAEKVAKLGADVVARYPVLDSEPRNPAELVELGTTSTGCPIVTNRRAAEADLLIATGLVEPHQYAGYSGGRKTVAIGVAGEAVIEYTHAPRFLDDPCTRLGCIEGNLFHQTVTEVAQAAGLKFILNAVLNEHGEIVSVRAGDPQHAFAKLVADASELYVRPIAHQYDIAVAGVGHPKDANLYQASRGPTYLYFAPTTVVRPGGVIIVPARLEEGAGEGVGEQRCYEALRDAESIKALLDELRARPFRAGEQRAYMIAQALSGCDIIVVGSECPAIVRDMKMLPAETMGAAFELAMERVGADARALVVPHALMALPVVTEQA
jgi:lactate racemase